MKVSAKLYGSCVARRHQKSRYEPSFQQGGKNTSGLQAHQGSAQTQLLGRSLHPLYKGYTNTGHKASDLFPGMSKPSGPKSTS